MEALLAELAGVDLNDITQDVVFQGKVGTNKLTKSDFMYVTNLGNRS